LGVPREGRWRVRFNSDWAGYDPEFEAVESVDADADTEPLDGMPFSVLIAVGPYASIVLSQDE
jgi:1,4-alpha-glucan branching enzyme